MRPLKLAMFPLLAGLTAGQAQTSDPTDFFQDRVQPIFTRCVACHSGPTPTGSLDLTSRESALKGGQSGPTLVPGHATESLLYKMVSSKKMPPGDPLPASEIEALREWIDAGALWGDNLGPKRAGLDWWALQRLTRTPVPEVRNKAWVRNPIDAFILGKLESQGLSPSPSAERVKLIRRVTYDLHGLPPTLEEIDAFVNDPSPDAYEKLLDRLLASPRYGERWGRHWLDVARFGESQGYERDKIRDHAWWYRDYVIESFNQDKPYRQFIKEQIAGDVLEPITRAGIIATGFLVAGPWDEVGNEQQSPVMRGRVREEELEDIVGVVSQTFLGMTANCARCHDHKFDPILQRDYYRLKAVFDGVFHGDRSILTPGETKAREQRIAPLQQSIQELKTEISAVEEAARQKVLAKRGYIPDKTLPKPIARWTFDVDATDPIGGLHGTLQDGAKISGTRLQFNCERIQPLCRNKGSVRTRPLPHDLREKTFEVWLWLTDLDLHGSAMGVETSKVLGVTDTLDYNNNKWRNSSEYGHRTKDLSDVQPESAAPGEIIHLAAVYSGDNRISIYRNGAVYGEPYLSEVKGPEGKLQVFPAGDARIKFGGGFLEIDEARLYDRALTAEQIARSSRAGAPSVGLDELLGQMTEDQRGRREVLLAKLTEQEGALKAVPPIPLGYAANSRQPGPSFVLERGDPVHRKEQVTAGALSAVRTLSPEFGLPADAPEGLRRVKLAEWIGNPDNPLTARVMVNRVWHYHFGRGIVATPNDFGFNGDRPSHPKLLNWLAAEFIAQGWRVKKLHKLIMLSSTYRQSSQFNRKAAEVDSENRLLWKFSLRRLEGEAIRDALLAVSGHLNPATGGPGFRPFEIRIFNTHFYDVTDPDGPEYNRRSVYRIVVRSGRDPLLEAFDCPDASATAPKRSVTTTPIQSLQLMNSPFMLRQARRLAARVKKEAGIGEVAKVVRAYRLTLGREPTPKEAALALSHLREHEVESLCWALLNSSEFLYLN